MKNPTAGHKHSSRRGSTLIVVIMLTVVAGTIIGSLLSFSLTEAKLNRADMLYNEARLAAESTLQHGMAQLRRRFDRVRQISPAEMEPNRASSLHLEPGFLNIARTTRMQVPSDYSRPAGLDEFLGEPTILGGLVVNDGNPVNLLIDPNTPLPEDGNPGVPINTDVREVRIYAKATVNEAAIGSRTAYVEQTFQVLDRSLFQNTVFYNGLLEVFPGADMNLGQGGGPIYAKDTRFGNNVRIHTRIETPGDFRIGRYHNSGDRNDTVYLTDFRKFDGSTPSDPSSAGYLTSVFVDGEQIQTGLPAFRELALQTYAGGLLTGEHGITGQAAVGLEFLEELAISDAEASGIDFNDSEGNFDQGRYDREGGNFGHLLIEPSRGLADLSVATNDAERASLEAFNSIEQNKWSNRSSLAIELDPVTGDIAMFHQPTDGNEPQFDSSGNRVRTEINVNTIFSAAEDRFWEVEYFSNGRGGKVESGLYDFRQAGGKPSRDDGEINLLRIDMGKMREWVEESGSATFDEAWWNGGVYVQLPEGSDTGRDDNVIPAGQNWAVQLHNGQTIPNRAAVDNDAPRGLTLSTNGALYVQGTYNAPNGETLDLDSYAVADGAEMPAALIGDAIMLLSDAWDNRNSGQKNLNDRKAADTTVSAALVTGNVPSAQGKYSGGLENYPRFLEKWSGRTLTYRGSLIRLFRSESFAKKWVYGGPYYTAPKRNWSFHTGYRQFSPPLDTGPRSFRQVYFKELTRAEFEDAVADLF